MTWTITTTSMTMIMTTTTTNKPPHWTVATHAVQSAKTILIVTHMDPDGDAFGAMLGLGNALKIMGKSVDCAVDGGMTEYAAFLHGADEVKGELKQGEWDVMISVDASDEARSGLVGEYGRAHSQTVINLDHHATNTLFGDIHLVEPKAVSATEVVYHWLEKMHFPFSFEVATPLLAGLVTDTLGFRTSNVIPNTLAIAQTLMNIGASLPEITARMLDNRSILEVNLWKHALATVQMHEHGIIVAEITQESLKKAGLNDMTDGGLVGYLVKVEEAVIAVVFKELDDGRVGLSMRSKLGYDVSEVAFALGGGGHKQAAGATLTGTLNEVRKIALPKLKEAAKKGKLTIG